MAIINKTTPVVTGTSLADVIDTRGVTTASSLAIGGLGNDIYWIDAFFHPQSGTDIQADVVKEDVGGGTDTINVNLSVIFNSVLSGNINPFTLFDNVENLNATLSGTGFDALGITGPSSHEFDLYGNASANTITVINNDPLMLAHIDGGAGNDTLVGAIGDDTLIGGIGIDSMSGGAGNDFYYVDNTSDVIVETANNGNDSVHSTATFTLANNLEFLQLDGTANINGTGNALDNAMYGNVGNNTLSGLAGNDSLYGGLGNDSLLGGIGNDVLNGEAGNDTLLGGAGDDTLYGGLGIDKLDGGDGSDTYIVYDASEIIADTGTTGEDTIVTTVQLAGDLATGIESLLLEGSALNGRGNALNNYIVGNNYSNTLFGLAGNDALDGGIGNDVLDGGDGNDTLDGGAGNDLMRGGNGNDTYIVDSAGDIVYEVNAVVATGGLDEVFSSVNFTLGNFVENLTLVGLATTGNGNALNNVITGDDSANTLSGYAGNDTLDGGSGADSMVGGDGNDLYIVDSNSDFITEASGGISGIDTVQTSVDFDMSFNAINVENLTLVGTAISAYGNDSANIITGNSLDNFLSGSVGSDTLIGGAGNDTLYGGSGADSMVGGLGDDLYEVDFIGDKVVELAGQGIDKISAAIDFSLLNALNVENLDLITGTNATGNGLNNEIKGNGGANKLDGGAGNDILNGAHGADTLIGGTGDDTYYMYGSEVIHEYASAGTDTILYFSPGALSLTSPTLVNIENALLMDPAGTDITGNALNNQLTGNAIANTLDGGAGNDTLDGGAGNDTLTGGMGNDVYIVDSIADLVNESVGGGVDTVKSSVNFDLQSNESGQDIENLTLTGNIAIEGFGNSLANIITGNDLDNNLYGGIGGNDTLIGGLGNDTLYGGVGTDRMDGGLGDDFYYVDVAGDVVVEGVNGGIDTVISNVSFNLASNPNVENVILYNSTGTTIATGNALNNVLDGQGYGNNVLSGGLGDDTLIAGVGLDTLTGGAGNDVFKFDGSFGIGNVGTITDFVAATDTLQLINFAGLNFTGAGNSLDASQFSLGAAAGNVNDFIIYDQASGNLYYSADTNPLTDPVQIAHLTPGISLSAADIFG